MYANGYTLICNFQIFLGEDRQTPPICPSPNFFLQKRLHIKKPLGTPLQRSDVRTGTESSEVGMQSAEINTDDSRPQHQ